MSVRIVILTGANRGLGRRTAEILLEKYSAGFHYIFTQRSADHTELTAALRKVNPEASFEIQTLELTDKVSRTAFLSAVASKHTRVDVLFNNAGYLDSEDNGNRPSKKVAQITLDINFICKKQLFNKQNI